MAMDTAIFHKSSQEENYAILVQRHGVERQEKFEQACVGIAGLGGLGSHVAIFLARLGIGRLILADFDVVDESNLHRQHYTFKDLGKPKTLALVQQLREINPYLEYSTHTERLTCDNIPHLFADCEIICEAFDKAEEKAMITECVLGNMLKPVLVGASGMAGTKSPNLMQVKKSMNRYFVCGDGLSDVENEALFAPRVALCAAQQATVIMQLILQESDIFIKQIKG